MKLLDIQIWDTRPWAYNGENRVFSFIQLIQSRQSELFSSAFVSLSCSLEDYEMLAFDKSRLHYVV